MVAWDALDALSHQLELCKIGADTRVVVLMDPTIAEDEASTLRTATARCGTRAIEVHITPEQAGDNPPLTAAIQASDLIITTGRHALHDSSHQVQSLHVHSIPADLFAPHANLRRRVRALATALHESETLTVSDTNGTRLTVETINSSVRFDHGIVEDDSPHASFPAGWVAITPAAHTTNGQLVLMPGDANLGAGFLINSPVVLQITDDHISAIEGESADADALRALLEYPAQSSAYGIAGLTVGLNPGAAPDGPFDRRLLDPVMSRLLAGIVRVSFGENLIADRPCPQTFPLALRERSVHLGALPAVVNGQLDGDFAPDVYEL